MKCGKNVVSRASAVTVGTFDGVHCGHKTVIHTLLKEASLRSLLPLAVTLDPHPMRVVAPERAPKLLETIDERLSHLYKLGVTPIVLPFSEEVRNLTAKQWLAMMKERFDMKLLICGYDNRFGSDGRNLSMEDISHLASELDIETIVATELPDISSSQIRRAIEDGDVAKAAKMLGRPYSLSGTVTCGRQLGQTIGFPTANLDVSGDILIPANGVYAALATLSDGRTLPAVVNIGNRPTIGANLPPTIEAHIPDFSEDLYTQPLRLSFAERIRDEQRFGSLEELKEAISTDIEHMKSLVCT